MKMKEFVIESDGTVSKGMVYLKITNDDGSIVRISMLALLANDYLVDTSPYPPMEKVDDLLKWLKDFLDPCDPEDFQFYTHEIEDSHSFTLWYYADKDVYQIDCESNDIAIKIISPTYIEVFSTKHTFADQIIDLGAEDCFAPKVKEMAPKNFSIGDVIRYRSVGNGTTYGEHIVIKDFYLRDALKDFLEQSSNDYIENTTDDLITLTNEGTLFFYEWLRKNHYLRPTNYKTLMGDADNTYVLD